MATIHLPYDQFLLNHELKTPLVGILGIAEHLSQETLSDEHHEQVILIQESGQRLLEVVNKILTCSRMRDFS